MRKINRRQLRRMILNEMYTSSGPNVEDALSTQDLYSLMQAGFGGEKLRGVDKANICDMLGPEAAQAIGISCGGKSSYESSGPDMSQALSTGELMELIAADQDPASSYSIKGRLEILNKGNLSREEQLIIGTGKYGYSRH